MAEEEEDREITLRWADRAALGSARTGLMRRVGGSAEEGGDDPSFFCSKPNAALSKQQQINKKPTPKNHPFFLRSHPAAAVAPWWGSAQITSRQLLPGVSGSPGHPAGGQDPACSRPPAPPSHRDLTLPFEIIVVFAKKRQGFRRESSRRDFPAASLLMPFLVVKAAVGSRSCRGTFSLLNVPV